MSFGEGGREQEKSAGNSDKNESEGGSLFTRLKQGFQKIAYSLTHNEPLRDGKKQTAEILEELQEAKKETPEKKYETLPEHIGYHAVLEQFARAQYAQQGIKNATKEALVTTSGGGIRKGDYIPNPQDIYNAEVANCLQYNMNPSVPLKLLIRAFLRADQVLANELGLKNDDDIATYNPTIKEIEILNKKIDFDRINGTFPNAAAKFEAMRTQHLGTQFHLTKAENLPPGLPSEIRDSETNFRTRTYLSQPIAKDDATRAAQARDALRGGPVGQAYENKKLTIAKELYPSKGDRPSGEIVAHYDENLTTGKADTIRPRIIEALFVDSQGQTIREITVRTSYEDQNTPDSYTRVKYVTGPDGTLIDQKQFAVNESAFDIEVTTRRVQAALNK